MDFSAPQRISAKFNYFWRLLEFISHSDDELPFVLADLKTIHKNQFFDKRKDTENPGLAHTAPSLKMS